MIRALPAALPKKKDLHQPHPGARVHCYRCFLPDLAGFAACRRGGTNAGDGSIAEAIGQGHGKSGDRAEPSCITGPFDYALKIHSPISADAAE